MLLPLQNCQLKYNTNFTANLNSPKLKFSRDDFFIRIQGYGKNYDWADTVIKTADNAVDNIRKKSPAEFILHLITDGVKNANKMFNASCKSNKTGILRTQRNGWECEPDCAYTYYLNNRYSSYAQKLNEVCTYPLEETPANLAISRPINYCDIEHGSQYDINYSLNHVFKSFKKIFPKYLIQDVKPENMSEVNSTIAEMRWVLAHATPWARGSDAISNVFMRSMYKAVGIKTYPVAEGVSLDLEAYCTELPQYIKKFTQYFEKPPEIVE